MTPYNPETIRFSYTPTEVAFLKQKDELLNTIRQLTIDEAHFEKALTYAETLHQTTRYDRLGALEQIIDTLRALNGPIQVSQR